MTERIFIKSNNKDKSWTKLLDSISNGNHIGISLTDRNSMSTLLQLEKLLVQNNNVSDISSHGNYFGNECCSIFASIIEHCVNLKRFAITFENIYDTGFIELMKALSVNRLESLEIGYNHVRRHGCMALANALVTNNSLTSLRMHSSGMCDIDCEPLFKALHNNSYLTNLSVSGNKLTDIGCALLAEMLRTNNSLKKLDLSLNKIGDTGCESLAKSLEHNNCIDSLNLSACGIESIGFNALFSMSATNKSITDLKIGVNKLNTNDCIQLATLLSCESPLQSLDIRGCDITHLGISHLAEKIAHKLPIAKIKR